MNVTPVPLPPDDIERLYTSGDDSFWDEIIAELPPDDDIWSEPYAFSTGDYATHEEGMAALWDWLCTLGNGEPDEKEPGTSEVSAARA